MHGVEIMRQTLELSLLASFVGVVLAALLLVYRGRKLLAQDAEQRESQFFINAAAEVLAAQSRLPTRNARAA